MTRIARVALALAALTASAAQAQRREGEAAQAKLVVKLTSAVRFGTVVLSPGTYRVSMTDAGLTFVLADNMVSVGTVPVQQATEAKVTSPATVELLEKGQEVAVIYRAYNDRFTATGTKESGARDDAKVELASKTETSLAGPLTETTGDEALVDGALKRLLPGVLQCADMAQRGRWQTDDPRFLKCVCPIAEKWRMPKVKAELRLHRFLVKGRMGLSLSVLPEGRVQGCRVWVGPKSPEETAAAVTPAVAPAAP